MNQIHFDLIFCPLNPDCPKGPPYRIIFIERGRRGEHGFLDFRDRRELEQNLKKIGVLLAAVEDGIMMMETGRICTVPDVQVSEAQCKRLDLLRRDKLHFPKL